MRARRMRARLPNRSSADAFGGRRRSSPTTAHVIIAGEQAAIAAVVDEDQGFSVSGQWGSPIQ
jgi:hypothetical protein